MGKKKEETPKTRDGLDGLDEAFDEALAGLSDANERVTEMLETMNDPETISDVAEVDEDGDLHDGEEVSEPSAEAEASDAESPEP